MGHAVKEGNKYLDANNEYNIQLIFKRNEYDGKKSNTNIRTNTNAGHGNSCKVRTAVCC